MKMFAVTFNKTDEYGDEYGETSEAVMLADNIEDIVEYVCNTYMPDATRSENDGMIILLREVKDFTPYYIHEILVYEVSIKSLTEKVSYLG